MHKDFHLYGTFYAARLAGFDAEKAQKIAFAAQAVDDFTYGEYASCCALETKDYPGYLFKSDIEMLKTFWTIFHFLPGGIDSVSESEEVRFITKPSGKLFTKLHENLAKSERDITDEDFWLAKAGVSMHVLADTFAHEGFSGIPSDYNIISDVLICGSGNLGPRGLMMHVPIFIAEHTKKLRIGHSTASHTPDISWIYYTYFDKRGHKVDRDNAKVFSKAFAELYKTLGGDEKKAELIRAKVETILKQPRKNIDLTKAASYTEEADNTFKNMLNKNVLGEFKEGIEGANECGNLGKGYEKYIKEINDLGKTHKEALKKSANLTESFKLLRINNFFKATYWFRLCMMKEIYDEWKIALGTINIDDLI